MFTGWENFYLMLGPAAAGLIGLLFVVVTLTAGRERSAVARGQALYLTPTALNFGVVMALSAAAMAPGLRPAYAGVLVGLGALVGFANALRSSLGIHGLRRSRDSPHWSDLWCYGVAPTAIYLVLLAVAVALADGAGWSAWAMAGLLLGLLLVSIRNAWDLLTFIAPGNPAPGGGGAGEEPS
jgi:hypothetical protein